MKKFSMRFSWNRKKNPINAVNYVNSGCDIKKKKKKMNETNENFLFLFFKQENKGKNILLKKGMKWGVWFFDPLISCSSTKRIM